MSFELPVECIESIATATVNLLEVIRYMGGGIKFFNAGSSECFGDIGEVPANESTLFQPLSPYAVAKSSAFWQVQLPACLRSVCCTILSNHESPLRLNVLSLKNCSISISLLIISVSLELGNLDVYRDWGWAPDYVKAMHLMLQNSFPRDFVIASGVTSSLREFARHVFAFYDLDFESSVVINDKFKRPSDLIYSALDPRAIQTSLGWSTIGGHQK